TINGVSPTAGGNIDLARNTQSDNLLETIVAGGSNNVLFYVRTPTLDEAAIQGSTINRPVTIDTTTDPPLNVKIGNSDEVILGQFGVASAVKLTNGRLDSSNSDFRIIGQTWTPSAVDITFESPKDTIHMTVATDGDVGIGDSTPEAKLDVQGDIIVGASSEKINITTIGGNPSIRSTRQLNLATGSGESVNILGGKKFRLYNGATSEHSDIRRDNNWLYVVAESTATGIRFQGTNGTDTMTIENTGGEVGIGTTSPSAQLDIRSDNSWGEGIKYTSSSIGGAGLNLISTATGGTQWSIISTAPDNGGGAGNLGFYETGAAYHLYIKSGGNVGIGDSSPSYKLDVNGDIRATGDLRADDDLFVTDDATITDVLSVGNDATITDVLSVGNDATITDVLSVGDVFQAHTTYGKVDALQGELRVFTDTGSCGVCLGGTLRFSNIGNYGSRIYAPDQYNMIFYKGNLITGYFEWWRDGGGDNRIMYLDNGGDLYIDGQFHSGGADYAEYFENLEYGKIEKGTIIALTNKKVKIAEKGDNNLGVVSNNPAIVGNSVSDYEIDDRTPEKYTIVALVGRTHVKVKGSVEEGDYIVLDDNGIGKATSLKNVNGADDFNELKEAIAFNEDVRTNSIGSALESSHNKKIKMIEVLIK
ncbi:peptidase G2 autoproteolytic cleavage domain-containing protein, partial [Candidatus Aenigmatarchaeota archaeon]